MTAVAGDVEETFRAALEKDAGRAQDGPPAVEPPPRRPDPEAPHGREEDGTPKAPYGISDRTGRPRIKPPGPGRGRGETPRIEVVSRETTPAAAGDAPDFSEDLHSLGMAVWLGGSCMRGGKLWFLRLPDTRPYAAAWKQELPGLVTAWNAAAQQNATVRGYVRKLSGEGSWSWVIGVAVSSVSVAAGLAEIARAAPEVRAAAAAANDAELELFMTAQLAAIGMEAGGTEAPG